MDSLITAAARALAAGDPLGALSRVALRDDAPALALRGIAMAQLGEFVRAKALVRRAARAFSPNEALARARCVVAEAEIALASRELGWPEKALDAARATLEAHGDSVNAAHARYLAIRRLLLIGRVDEAARTLAALDAATHPPALLAAHELIVAGIALRRIETKPARAALARAERAARDAGIPALAAEVERAFRVKHADESHRARLRVEIGRLRALLGELADIRATQRGFVLTPRRAPDVAVLTRPHEDAHVAVLALLADGESWSSSALALALGASQRTVQRSLDALAAAGNAQSFGCGRARRWTTPPVPGFATTLLLPAPLPGD